MDSLASVVLNPVVTMVAPIGRYHLPVSQCAVIVIPSRLNATFHVSVMVSSSCPESLLVRSCTLQKFFYLGRLAEQPLQSTIDIAT
jgi:hypothetical protein